MGGGPLRTECNFELTRQFFSPEALDLCGQVTHSMRVVMSRTTDANIAQLSVTCTVISVIAFFLLIVVFLNSILWHAFKERRWLRTRNIQTFEYASNRLRLAALAMLMFIAMPILYCIYTGEDMSSADLDMIWLLIFVAIILVRAAR